MAGILFNCLYTFSSLECIKRGKAKIIAIIEFNGGLINTSGINVEKAKLFFSKHGTFKNCPEGKFQEKTDAMLTAEYDILIPAAKENVIDQKNAKKIKSKLIVEAANGPISFEADEILNKQGVIIIPDIIAAELLPNPPEI